MLSIHTSNILGGLVLSAIFGIATLSCMAKSEAELIIDNGVDKVHAGHFAEGIILFKKALQLEPRNALGYYDLGLAYYKQQQNTKARDCFNKAVEYDSHMAAAWSQLAGVCERQKDYPSAENALKHACALEPCCIYFDNLAKLYLQLGRLAEARPLLLKARCYPESKLPEHTDIEQNLKLLDEKLNNTAGK